MIDQVQIPERVGDDGDQVSDIRAAIYARTSSAKQTYGYSLQEQVQQGIQRCRSLGWEIAFIYRDEAESGKDTDRPQFQQMIEAAKKDAFDVIVFWKLDRFSRSLMHAVQLEEELREFDIALYSLTEQINTTTASGRFNFRNIASAAEFERDMIQQRTEVGLQGMAKENKWPNDSPPLGYRLSEDQTLEVVDAEEELVNEIFDLYIELRSMPDVAQTLNDRGETTQNGGEWTRRAVGDILRNEIYRGQYELREISKHVPEYQIIDDETFEEVTSIRMRFQNGDSSRPEMADERKEDAIDEIHQQYEEYLQRRH